MEASDVDDEMEEKIADSLPLGSTFRSVPRAPSVRRAIGGFLPRKLSTISSRDKESNKSTPTDEEVNETTPLRSDQQVAALVLGQDNGDNDTLNEDSDVGKPDASSEKSFELKDQTKEGDREDQKETVIGATTAALSSSKRTRDLKKKFLESDM